MVWRLVVEVRQLEVWKRWSQVRESQTGQSVKDLLEYCPEQSTEGRGLVEAESQANVNSQAD